MCAFQSRHLSQAGAASALQARQSLSIYLMTKCLLMHATEVGKVPGCNMKQNVEHLRFSQVLKGHVNLPSAETFPMFILSSVTLVQSKKLGCLNRRDTDQLGLE